ncbi:unnamed protein product [Wickerhamomyces anomalus]
MALNKHSIMELMAHIGVYPISQELTISNLVKGYILIWIFVHFVLLNGFISLNLRFAGLFVSESTIVLIKSLIAQGFWNSLIYLINKRKIKIIVGGLDLNDGAKLNNQLKNSIVISNHRSLFDFILIYYLKNLVERTTNDQIELSFFNWNSLWKVPSVKTIYNFLQNDENWTLDLLQVEKFYLPKLDESLYPRFNNFNNLTSVVNSNQNSPIRNLIDLTILYYNPVKNTFTNPSLFEILTLKQPFFIINIDVKVKPINKLPTKQRKLEKWLENDWCEKDKTIELMQKQLKINE